MKRGSGKAGMQGCGEAEKRGCGNAGNKNVVDVDGGKWHKFHGGDADRSGCNCSARHFCPAALKSVCDLAQSYLCIGVSDFDPGRPNVETYPIHLRTFQSVAAAAGIL